MLGSKIFDPEGLNGKPGNDVFFIELWAVTIAVASIIVWLSDPQQRI